MPNVTIEMWEGRPVEKKRELTKVVTDAIVGCLQCPPDAVNIVIYDVPKHNWAKGGKLASDK